MDKILSIINNIDTILLLIASILYNLKQKLDKINLNKKIKDEEQFKKAVQKIIEQNNNMANKNNVQ